jgi:hypothetical protein
VRAPPGNGRKARSSREFRGECARAASRCHAGATCEMPSTRERFSSAALLATSAGSAKDSTLLKGAGGGGGGSGGGG